MQWQQFRASELMALYRECVRCAEDDEDAEKLASISNAYANITGEDIRVVAGLDAALCFSFAWLVGSQGAMLAGLGAIMDTGKEL